MMHKWLIRLAYAGVVLAPVAAGANYFATQPGSGTTFASAIVAGAHYVQFLLTDSTGADVSDTTNHAIKVNVVAGGAGGGAVTNAGTFATQLTGATNNINNIAGTVSLPTGAATAALQGTNSATTAHTCSVAGFSELGCLGQLDDDIKAALPAGTNQIGFVGLQSNTTGGCTPTRVLSAATTNSTSVKGSAGTVCSITIIQNTATAADFRLYDSASAPTCSSATGVVANYGIQANTSSPGLSPNLGPFGMNFTTGIGFCLTAYDGTDTNNSNSVTGIQINIAYK